MGLYNKIVFARPWEILLSIIIVFSFIDTFLGEILLTLWLLVFCYWTLKVGNNLYSQLDNKSILNLKRFKYFVIFCTTYFLSIKLLGFEYEINESNYKEFGISLWIIIPLHFLFFFGIIYSIYFLSRCIVSLRKKGENYGWYMLGFWFFFIGVWIIQPRIIKLLSKKNSNVLN